MQAKKKIAAAIFPRGVRQLSADAQRAERLRAQPRPAKAPNVSAMLVGSGSRPFAAGVVKVMLSSSMVWSGAVKVTELAMPEKLNTFSDQLQNVYSVQELPLKPFASTSKFPFASKT